MNVVAPDAAAASAIAKPQDRLKLTEIFLSLQGEARDAGWPTVFVRLAGCPLRCQYCDTAYAFHGGQWWDIDAIVAEVARHGVRHVCVTGGEPLAQKRCIALLSKLCDAGYVVSLETSGAIDISGVDTRVSRVLDIKTPGSGEVERNLWSQPAAADRPRPGEVRRLFARGFRLGEAWCPNIACTNAAMCCFSPSHAQVSPRELADWIVAEQLPVRFQLQLHKILWGEEPGK